MRRPLTSIFVTVVVATSLVASTRQASAQAQQLPEAERKAAARSLFTQGLKEQEAGHPGEALGLFEKAQKLFDAPTHLLHIAQCQVLTGKLVEAAETYETLKRVTLGPNPPEVFVQAKTQAEAELPGVRARIPNLKIEISPKPEQLRNLQLVINDVLLPIELVGVARPVNPGVAKISARADGYLPTSLEVTIREKETRSAALSLTPGGPAVAPVPLPPPPQPYPNGSPGPSYGQPSYGQNPGPGIGPTAGLGAPPPFPPKEEPKPVSSAGFIAGLHLGATSVLTSPTGTSNTAFTGGADFMFRFAKVVLAGATAQFSGNSSSAADDSTYLLAGRISFLTHPEKFAFTAGALFGARGNGSADPAGAFGGTLGFSIPIGTHFRLEPRLDITASRVGQETTPFAFFGLGAAYNHNFKPKAPEPEVK
jgi:hypothetical protein